MIFRRIITMLVALAVAILLVVTIGAVMAEETAPEALSLTVTPLSPEPVPAGDPVVFKVILDNVNAQNQTNLFLELNWDKRMVQRARVEIVDEETEGVRTQGVRREAGMAVWRGGIQNGGRLTLQVTLLPALCYNEKLSVDLFATAGKVAGGPTLQADDSLIVDCPANQFSPEELVLTTEINRLAPFAVYDATADVLKGMPADLLVQLKNNTDQPVNALVTNFLDPQSGQEGSCTILEDQVRYETQGAPTLGFDRGYLEPFVTAGAQMTGEPYLGFMILELQPGETWSAKLRVPLRGQIPGCEFNGQATVYPAAAVPIPGSCDGGSPSCRYLGWTTRSKDLQTLFRVLNGYDGNRIAARMIAADLGDAPASDNNFDTPMSAYPEVKADFPTVFNFNIGMPPTGSKVVNGLDGLTADHREAPLVNFANPLRLGDLASVEREADIPPSRNINPLADLANLDLRDDGWPLSRLPASCEPFNQKVKITVEQWAVDYFAQNGGMAYLNVFVDANGDGDWEDAGRCGGQAAPEHLFINLPIDIISLGVGQHEIQLPANKGVQWQTDQTWLRVILGEQQVPLRLQSGNTKHGDGSGPQGGFLIGEIEDYRLPVGEALDMDAAFGADLAVRIGGEINVLANHGLLAEENPFGIQATTGCLTCIDPCATQDLFINFGNLGDRAANGSQLIIMPDPAMRDEKVEINIKGDLPWNPDYTTEIACSPNDPTCQVAIDLGDVPAGKFGSFIVSTAIRCDDNDLACKKKDFAAQVMIQSPDDQIDDNNQGREEWLLPLAPEWMVPPSITYPIPGTTSESDLLVKGKGYPGRIVDVYINNQKVGSGPVDRNGNYMVELSDIVEMFEVDTIQLAVGYQMPGGGRNTTRPMTVIVDDTGLFVNPLSLQFTMHNTDTQPIPLGLDNIQNRNLFTFSPWDPSGRVDLNGWQVPLLAGVETDVETEPHFWCLTCTLGVQAVDIVLKVNATDVLATLTDPDGDGRYSGSFTPDQDVLDQPLSLHVTGEGVEQVYQGRSVAVDSLPKLIDGQTGAPLAGIEVHLWRQVRTAGGEYVWVRPTEVNGQPNPRTTAADGSFFFNVPRGIYRLQYFNEGFHNGRFTDPEALVGIFPSRNIIVNGQETLAALDSTANADLLISITPDGFSPPVLEAQVGDVVTWQNVSLQSRGVRNVETGINSGFLPAGETFSLQFSEPGAYTLFDPEDPQNKGLVILKPGPGETNVFFPGVFRP